MKNIAVIISLFLGYAAFAGHPCKCINTHGKDGGRFYNDDMYQTYELQITNPSGYAASIESFKSTSSETSAKSKCESALKAHPLCKK